MTKSAAVWRKPALAASIAIHAVGLTLLAMRTLPAEPVPGAEQVVFLEIEPRPLLPDEPIRVPRPAQETTEVRTASGGATAPANPSVSEDPQQRPEPPSPRLAAPVAGSPPPEDSWTVRPQTLGQRIGRGLRTRSPGCALRETLTPSERALCDDRFGERAAAARPIQGSGNPERDAAFAAEGARALARYEARRRPLSGGVGVVGPGDCPGSNLGAGCAGAHLPPDLRQGASTTHNGAQQPTRQGVSARLGGLQMGGRGE